MRNGQCPKCGSATIYAAEHGATYKSEAYVSVLTGGFAPWSPADFVTFLCTSCGYFENYVADPKVLAKVTTAKDWQKVPVYDPAQPSHVATVGTVAGGMMGGAASGVPAAFRHMDVQLLMQYDAANRQLLKTGLPATAQVLQYTSLGFNVKGNNPAVNLVVEVHPADRPAFTSQVQGAVIAEASIPKCQPGQMLTVRYNPSDLTKVALERLGV